MGPESFGSISHTGYHRDGNEDSFAVCPGLGLFVVADGLGGAPAGEVASAVAVTTIVNNVRDGRSLSDAVHAANRAVVESPAGGVGAVGMGTTIVAARVLALSVEICWVGDSRAYFWDGQLSQVTKDDTVVQLMVERGQLSAFEAEFHPAKHRLIRALGFDQVNLPVGRIFREVARGTRFMLCSDGLVNELDGVAIANILGCDRDPQYQVDRLVSQALDAGGDDNITVVIFCVD